MIKLIYMMKNDFKIHEMYKIASLKASFQIALRNLKSDLIFWFFCIKACPAIAGQKNGSIKRKIH